jgi:hypothetical protein
MLRNIIIGVSIFVVIGFIAFIVWWIMLINSFGLLDRDYSLTELKQQFEKNKKEIYELRRYFIEIVPKKKFVEIEFKNENTLFRFGIKELDSLAGDRPMFLEWHLKTNTARMDSIIQTLGWTKETLKTLKYKLDKADCIQIESGNPVKIGFKRSGMGMYSFNVFDKPIPDSLRANYNDSCIYIFVNDRLVLEYSGGAIGNQCFYNLK